jgi:hypothetical protein
MAAGDLIGYEIEIRGLDEQLRKLKQADVIIDRRLTEAMTRTVLTVESAVKPLVPVFRGRLRGSIGSQVKRDGPGSIIGTVGSSLQEAYPAVMEFGRRPGAAAPPSAALSRWAHLVLGDASLAFVVARAINSKVIKGRFFMKRGYERVKGQIVGFFQDALDHIAKDLSIG